MQTIVKLPEKNGTIGAREIIRSIRNGRIKHVVVADNCPEFLFLMIKNLENQIKIEKFEGDESQMGTKLGKPFPVAMVGYE